MVALSLVYLLHPCQRGRYVAVACLRRGLANVEVVGSNAQVQPADAVGLGESGPLLGCRDYDAVGVKHRQMIPEGLQNRSVKLVTPIQLLLCHYALINIYTRADVTGKRTVSVHSGYADIEKPPEAPVMPSEPVLHTEGLALIEGLFIRFEALLEVVRVDTGRPAIAKFVLKSPAGEVQPGLIEIVAEVVGPRHPDQHGSCVGDQTESSLALA